MSAIDPAAVGDYTRAAYSAARQLTERYSTSFSSATRLFDASIRDDIYAIYGLLRTADELVDSYGGVDAARQLAELEQQTAAALRSGYSTNLLVHAFAQTARQYGIDNELLRPFFASMAMDLRPVLFDQVHFQQYIHGSAEVVGLMCLWVFCQGDDDDFQTLAPGAVALGRAFQKVNFLRDLAADQHIGRRYFPQLQHALFDEAVKQQIISDIKQDFDVAAGYVERLPMTARPAVRLSYEYYGRLLTKLQKTAPEAIAARRVRLSSVTKLGLWLGSQLVD